MALTITAWPHALTQSSQQTCINNMVQIASSQLGCSAGNVTCYCTQPDFGYGVRDCANEACQNTTEAQSVITFGVSYCSSETSQISSVR